MVETPVCLSVNALTTEALEKVRNEPIADSRLEPGYLLRAVRGARAQGGPATIWVRFHHPHGWGLLAIAAGRRKKEGTEVPSGLHV